MSKLQIEWDNNELLKVSGTIDENSEFSEITAQFGEKVYIDLQHVTRINSCGVRQWIRGLAETKSQIIYINMPPIIVDQLSMVPEFGGSNFKVASFLAEYSCESCGYEGLEKLIPGEDVEFGLEDYEETPAKKCPKCGKDMEFEHSPEVYFAFLGELSAD